MKVILLENMRNVGLFGAEVRVAPGFGRNYLIPKGKAVPANAANKARFEADRFELEAKADARLTAAKARAEKMADLRVTIAARAADEGKLYGSVGTAEIANAIVAAGYTVTRQEVRLTQGVLREIGEYDIQLQLHPEVLCSMKVQVISE